MDGAIAIFEKWREQREAAAEIGPLKAKYEEFRTVRAGESLPCPSFLAWWFFWEMSVHDQEKHYGSLDQFALEMRAKYGDAVSS